MAFNLADLFEGVADATPSRPALVAGDRNLTYAALDARANRVAHHLLDAGIEAGMHVGIHSHNRAEWIEVMLGCLKARMVPVNVNFRYVAEELRYLFADADLAALFFEGYFGTRVAEAREGSTSRCHLVVIHDDGDRRCETLGAVSYEDALMTAAHRRGFTARSGDDRYIIYTGGTTGLPKGVVWRQGDLFGAVGGGLQGGSVVTRLEQITDAISPHPPTTLALGPLMHGNAQWTTFLTFFMGGTVVLYTGSSFDPVAVWDVVDGTGVNTISLVGDAMARPLVEALAGREPPASLVALVSGGALLSPAVKEEIRAALPGVLVLDSFGASETGAHGLAEGTTEGPPRFRMNAETAVLGADLQPLPVGEVGMLARRGHVPLGYYKDAVATAETFPEAGGVRWAIAGDRARLEADGTVTVLGRGSHTIITGGEKVYPEEVEAALKAHPAVFDAVVVGVSDARWGERVAAVVQPREAGGAEPAALTEHCRARLAGYKVPRFVAVVDHVERTAAGKPDYRWAAGVVAEQAATPSA